MSTNVSKVLRVVSSNKKISTKLYEFVINDNLISHDLKRKIGLYYKGDKRQSIIKLKSALKENKLQHGGGWKIGVVANKGAVNIQGSKLAYDYQGSDTITHNVQETININSIEYTINTIVGSGALANVYDINTKPDLVVKIFRQDIPVVYDNTKKCINEFLTYFENKIQYTSFPLGETDLFVQTNEQRNGYFMMKMNQINIDNVTSLIKDFEKAKQTLLDSKHNTTNIQFNFIHGDIKIENMLNHNERVVMTDMDGVFVYNLDTLQHKTEYKYDRQIYMTPVCTHPILPWYTQMLRIGNNQFTFTSSDDHMVYWDAMWAHMNMNNSSVNIVHKTIIDILNEKYGDYKIAINVFLSNSEQSNKITWLMNQLKLVDLYSLGASAIFHSLKKKNTNLYIFGKRTILESLENLPFMGGVTQSMVSQYPLIPYKLKKQQDVTIPFFFPNLVDDIVNKTIIWNPS